MGSTSNPAKEGQMSHDEIWDDSALVDSWNEALDEYQKYHSIHRNGGNVNDLLASKNPDGNLRSDAKHSPDELHHSPDPDAIQRGPELGEQATDGERGSGKSDSQHSHPHGAGPGPVPAGLLGSVRDEGLKKLLMSWYYAGYYTGYYEGQRDSAQ
ncbi:hypothetical protein F5Y15DRAFT_381438 [Xylariaceae sp. FL0016]|nr:hypothetical protein F5Y15DRAFT_381438 [Xylariaceae sp. FL0016]